MKILPPYLDTAAPAGMLEIVPDKAAGFASLRAIVIAVFFVMAFAGMVELVREEWLDPTILVLNVVPIWLGVRFCRSVRRTMRGWAALLTDLPSGPLSPGVVERFLNENPLGSTRFAVRYLMRILAAGGHMGQGLRIGFYGPRLPIRPLVVPFEPLRLDETDDMFWHLSESTQLKNVASRRSYDNADQVLRRLRRFLRYIGWLAPIAVLVPQLITFPRFGRPGSSWVIWPCIIVFVLVFRGFWWRRRHFLAVPGGVMVRRSKWPGGWRGQLFTRQSSAACCHQLGPGQWSLIISDGKVVESAQGTEAEMTLALRAWYSPLAPPTLEQLRELI